MKNILTIPFIIAMLLLACRPKPIPIKVDPAEEKLAIASRIIPNRIMLISLTRSFSALEAKKNEDSLSNEQFNRIVVKNALVTVSYGNKTDTLYKIQDGLYGSVNTLLSNYNEYRLYAKDQETGKEINATTYMLPYYQFDSVRPYKKISGKDTSCHVYYELSDNINREDYYVVNYIRKLNSSNGKSLDINQLFSNGSSSFETDFDLLNDASFTNGKYKLDKLMESVRPTDSIAVSIALISKGYYEFLSAFKRAGNVINTLTGEPITYPTNVNNGYGYFNAYYPQILFYDMKNR